HSQGDDIVIYEDEQQSSIRETLCHLRQQNSKVPGKANYCLADFLLPVEAGYNDYIGAFAVTAGIGIEAKLAEFERQHDDYSAIMLKALADRLAEAFAEYMHQQVRVNYWGYSSQEALDNQALIKESYEGIRPAPGYPACPDHTEKDKLFSLLSATENTGIELTESYAMYPTAAVSGWYLAHADARFFNVGKITTDQLTDYANRKGWSIEEARRWLAPNLQD
ncbi:MAG TPA: methionine synthase, partial [Methylococcaceae bacterium]|nr:methionine synthase [Methylococcaceae bacterium]